MELDEKEFADERARALSKTHAGRRYAIRLCNAAVFRGAAWPASPEGCRLI
jgi:hypothetical protein